MKFEDAQLSSLPEPPEGNGLNTRFLQSMGFGEEELRALDSSSENESEDEVALSSLPEDLEIPGTVRREGSGIRVVEVEISNSTSSKETSTRLEASVDSGPTPEIHAENRNEEAEPAPVAPPEEQDPAVAQDPEADLLHLACPSCGEELLLRAEHVGIEGACVWCDAKIVAARAGLGGDVKIFPLEMSVAGVEKPVEPVAEDAEDAEEKTIPDSDGNAEPVDRDEPAPGKAPTAEQDLFFPAETSPASPFGSSRAATTEAGYEDVSDTAASSSKAATPSPSGSPASPSKATAETVPVGQSDDASKSGKTTGKGPGKGLAILLVILIGFACGAALASFVLPVDIEASFQGESRQAAEPGQRVGGVRWEGTEQAERSARRTAGGAQRR